MSFTINECVVSGNLCADPVLKATPGGTPVLELRVAVNERVKRGEEWVDDPSFLTCVVFGGTASYLADTLSKGAAVAVSGRLKECRWQAKDGSPRSRVEIRARDVVPCGGRGKGASHRQGQAPAAEEAPMSPQEAAAYMGARIIEGPVAAAPDMYAEEIPF